MKRCYLFSLATFATFAFALLAGLAHAQNNSFSDTNGQPVLTARTFPANAVRGEMQVLAAPDVRIDGKPDRLSPAIRIRDINNNLVLSSTVSGQKLVVNYVRDNTGLVQLVWVLNTEEVRQMMLGQEGGFFSNIRSMFESKPVTDDGNTPYDKLPSYKR